MAQRLSSVFYDGLVRRNPSFVVVLGNCPTLATTTQVKNALAMGVAATAVLVMSNVIISLIRRVIPNEIRIPCFVVVIAGFVTAVEILMKGLLPPAINKQLGIFIALIVVNCIIFFRAEEFASKYGVVASAVDGVGMGLGFTWAIALIATIREVLGAGTFFGYRVGAYPPATVLVMAPGAFIVLGLILATFEARRNRGRRRAARVPRAALAVTSKEPAGA